jgi:hypothetical protein
MRYTVMLLAQEVTDYGFGVKVRERPGIEAWGPPQEMVLEQVLEAIDRQHEVRIDSGEPLPKSVPIDIVRVSAEGNGPRCYE